MPIPVSTIAVISDPHKDIPRWQLQRGMSEVGLSNLTGAQWGTRQLTGFPVS